MLLDSCIPFPRIPGMIPGKDKKGRGGGDGNIRQQDERNAGGAGAARTCTAEGLPPPLLLLAALGSFLVGVVGCMPDA